MCTGGGYQDNQFFLKSCLALSAVLSPQRPMILIRFVTTRFLFVDGNMPRTNEVDVNFMSRENGNIAECELSCLTGRRSNLWVDFAIGDYYLTYLREVWMAEMSLNDSFKSIHSSRMNCNVVIPFDGRIEHCVRKQIFP